MTRARSLVAAATCAALAAACTASSVDADPSSVQVGITPRTASVTLGGTVTFSASVTGTTDTRVIWSVQEAAAGGAISNNGLYTAPGTPGTYHVVATSVADEARSDTATVAVTATPVVQVEIAPHTVSVTFGGTVTFSASVTGTTDTRVTWSVQEGVAGGAISSAGLYTAAGTPGTYHVVATSLADSTKSDTATVSVAATPVVQVAIAPHTASVTAGGIVTFSASVKGTSDARVTWSVQEGAAGGTISSTGLYTAPATAGTYHVVATSLADGTKSDTATVTVTASEGGAIGDKLAVIATKRIYFGHQSTGANILFGPDEGGTNDGLASLIAQNPGSGLSIVSTTNGSAIRVGAIGHSSIGANGDPNGKIESFKTLVQGTLRNGTPADLDVAFFKLCWIDFGNGAGALAVQNQAAVDALFAHYRTVMDALIAEFPRVKFLHVTAPLRTPGNYYTGLATNALREGYNNAIRAYYPAADILDLADWESTGADGRRVYTSPDGTGIFYDNPTGHVRALSTDWDSDGGHLDSAGSTHMAEKFVDSLAAH